MPTSRMFYLRWSALTMQPIKIYSKLPEFVLRCWKRVSSKVFWKKHLKEGMERCWANCVINGGFSCTLFFVIKTLRGREKGYFHVLGTHSFSQISAFCSIVVPKTLLDVVCLWYNILVRWVRNSQSKIFEVLEETRKKLYGHSF